MTKAHRTAATIVRNILNGEWTFEAPEWADESRYDSGIWDSETEETARYTRAVQTAEAFCFLFTQNRARFNRAEFLRESGLS